MKFEPCKEFVYCPYCPIEKAYLKEYNRVGYIRVNGIRTNDIFDYISYKYECDICSRKYTTTESDELSQYNYLSREKSQKRNNKINKIWE
jgi:hypothetical protein